MMDEIRMNIDKLGGDDKKSKLYRETLHKQLKDLEEEMSVEDIDAWYDEKMQTSKMLLHSFPYLYYSLQVQMNGLSLDRFPVGREVDEETIPHGHRL